MSARPVWDWMQSTLLDPTSPVGLDKDLFVGLVSSLIGAVFTIVIITPLTARYVRLQSNRSWRSTRLYYVDSFAQQIREIGGHLLAIRDKLRLDVDDEDLSPEIVIDMGESVSSLLETAIGRIDTVLTTFNNSAYAFNAECHYLFADVRKTLTKAKLAYASKRNALPSDAVETIRIDYIMTDRLLIENEEGVVVRGNLFASDVGVAWRKSARGAEVAGETEEVAYRQIFAAFEKFARFACGDRYAESKTIGDLQSFYRDNRDALESSFEHFDRFRETLRASDA